MRRVQTVYEGDSLGKRLGRFVSLLVIVFAIVAAVIVTQRLSDDALALVVGLLLAGIPLLAVIALLGFFLAKLANRDIRPQQMSQMSVPPIVLQMPIQPPQLPDYGAAQQWQGTQPQRGRAWDMIGED